MYKATVTCPNIEVTNAFIRSWTSRTLRGYDRSAIKEDGSFVVTVYDVTENEIEFINNFVKENNHD